MAAEKASRVARRFRVRQRDSVGLSFQDRKDTIAGDTMNDKMSGQLMYILVIDTDVNERFTMSMLLQRFGYTVCVAGSVREGVEFLCVAPAVAIFADAEATGPDLLARLAGDARFRNVPVVLAAEASAPGLEERVRRGELAGLIRKPLDIDNVYQVIQKVIEKGSRVNVRISAVLPAKLQDGSKATEGHVTVLSQYGMFFRTLDHRPAGTRLAVDLSLWDRVITVEAVVLYVVSFEEGPFCEPGMGMKVVRINPEDNDLIRAFIHDQLWEGLAPLDPTRGYRGGAA
jgi:CheY-like chemotaxis protein